MLRLLIIICVFAGAWGLKVIFERAGFRYMNEKYVESAVMKVARYVRRSDYYLNVEVAIRHTWMNNVTCHFIFNEYLHNEYRRSFIEFHFKFCDMLNMDPYFGKLLTSAGLQCPALPGMHRMVNLTAPTENFPNVFPFEKGRIDALFINSATNETMVTGEVFALFKNSKKRNG